MTISDLNDYRINRNAAERLSKRIEQMRTNIKHSTVKGSSYAIHAKVRVFAIAAPDSSFSRKVQELEKHEYMLRQKNKEIENFINSITDETIRQIVECHFEQGLTWEATAEAVYGYASKSTPRMAFNRYLAAKHSGI